MRWLEGTGNLHMWHVMQAQGTNLLKLYEAESK